MVVPKGTIGWRETFFVWSNRSNPNSMRYLPLIIFVAIIIIALFLKEIFDRKETGDEVEKWPYLKKSYLLTEAEKNFYFILRDILKNEYLLFSKVRLCDLLYLPKHQRSFKHYWNKIQSKHVDFLICEKQDIRPLLVIELDDFSHLQDKRIKRDNFVNQALKDADLPILHIKNSYNYNQSELSEKIKSLIL